MSWRCLRSIRSALSHKNQLCYPHRFGAISSFRCSSGINTEGGSIKDYYKILNVKPTASLGEIKDAYRKLSKKLHPDTAGSESTSKFLEATEAYSILSKSETRQEYDANRRLHGLGLYGDSFRMVYPQPSKDLAPDVLEAFDEEMRRRWHTRLEQWSKSQSQYELERGIMMETVADTEPRASPSDKIEQETRALLFLAFLVSVGILTVVTLRLNYGHNENPNSALT